MHWLDEARRSHEQLVALTATLHSILGTQLFIAVVACVVNLVNALYIVSATLLERASDRNGNPLFTTNEYAMVYDMVFYTARLVTISGTAEDIKAAVSATNPLFPMATLCGGADME